MNSNHKDHEEHEEKKLNIWLFVVINEFHKMQRNYN